jgi:chaperone modulatory protein CbpM
LDQREFAARLQIDERTLCHWLDRGWISPRVVAERQQFQEVDLARGALICDLADELGVNDDGVDVILDLLDQLHGLRRSFVALMEALEVQPDRLTQTIMRDAHKLQTLRRRRQSRLPSQSSRGH